jgi:hypothetical protein
MVEISKYWERRLDNIKIETDPVKIRENEKRIEKEFRERGLSQNVPIYTISVMGRKHKFTIDKDSNGKPTMRRVSR